MPSQCAVGRLFAFSQTPAFRKEGGILTKGISFVQRHLLGLVGALGALIGGFLAMSLYNNFQGPVEARLAANQVNDSAVAFAVHEQMQANLVAWIVWSVVIIVALLFLVPAIKDAISILSAGKE
jgi:hypothetical protein